MTRCYSVWLRLTLPLIFLIGNLALSSHVAMADTPLRAEQQSTYPTVFSENGNAEHVYGYTFTPSSDGMITRLGGRFYGSKFVVVIDNSSTSILGYALVVGQADRWSYTPVANGAISIRQGRSYTVAARMGADSSGRAIWGMSLPFTRSGVTVDAAVQGWSSQLDPAAWILSIQTIPDQSMKGLLDIDFQPGPGGTDPEPEPEPEPGT